MVNLKVEKGEYIFKLQDILREKNISINKLMRETSTDFKVIKRLMVGDIIRVDIFVIARLCDYLNCNISEIIEYIPNNEKQKRIS
ncbi:MAG: helix-turn-helix transcriptional regulator [Clostridia bacterium]|nr:helix-turn-helix transcriptional regulator [Clostridia bacterium]